ncbi:MAG TPA: DHHW family protein [bacterium]|nr:DHHW family protein [bacterium]
MENKEREKRIRWIIDMCVVLCFFACLISPAVVMIAGCEGPSMKELFEPKTVAASRSGGGGGIDSFRSNFKNSFGLRKPLIKLNAIIYVKCLGVSSNKNVLLGRDGWLFYVDEAVIERYRRTYLFSEEYLDAIYKNIERKRDFFKGRETTYIFLAIPDKITIYPEYFPANQNKVYEQSNFDQIVEHMRKNSNYPLIDLRPALLERKKTGAVFYKTDTHWTPLGAYTGYVELVKEIGLSFPGMEPMPLSDFNIIEIEKTDGDLARMLGLENSLLETTNDLVALNQVEVARQSSTMNGLTIRITRCPDAKIPRAVIFHDSFMLAMMPFLEKHFKTAVFVHTAEIDLGIIDRVKPNIVIMQMLERNL